MARGVLSMSLLLVLSAVVDIGGHVQHPCVMRILSRFLVKRDLAKLCDTFTPYVPQESASKPKRTYNEVCGRRVCLKSRHFMTDD